MLEDESELSAVGGDEKMMPVEDMSIYREWWRGDNSRGVRGACVSERQGVRR